MKNVHNAHNKQDLPSDFNEFRSLEGHLPSLAFGIDIYCGLPARPL